MNEARAARIVGRFAPSPTGPLHMGSLVAAVGSYLFARARGGRWLVRVEDLDPPRVVVGSEDAILVSLDAYGLHWDGDVIRQSARAAEYDAALSHLREKGLTFECACSRAEIQQASSAPSPSSPGESTLPVYPGTCRSGLPPGRTPRATRFLSPDAIVEFDDLVLGRIRENIARQTGDFVIRRADGPHAYQLAVVVDDIAQGVNQVVRGADLVSSTPRQIAIIRALGAEPPKYGHVPLVTDGAGEKLSKRTGAIPLPSSGERRLAESLLIALQILGVDGPNLDTPDRMLAEAVASFDPTRIPKQSVAFDSGQA